MTPLAGWVSQVGRWTFPGPGAATYLGPQQQTSRPFGICVSKTNLNEGTIRFSALIETPQLSSEPPSAALTLGYISWEADDYYAVGIGGHDLKYTFVHFTPASGWRLLKGAGHASDLKTPRAYLLSVRIEGAKVGLYDEGNLVFDYTLPTQLPRRGRVGLLAWGDTGIHFTRISSEANIDPSDVLVSNVLESFDREGVYKTWMKALDRRAVDPDGAITLARTLLESVCKLILEKKNHPYSPGDNLPQLYRAAARALNVAPDQHTESTLKSMLGSCQNVVSTLGELRNKIGDAHGRAAQLSLPAVRHATLAVNLAGAMAMFLVDTAGYAPERP